jgi:SAM-dependent methyltransferase
MTTAPGNLYDYPRYYDLVFGSDWKAEYDFLLAVFEQFGGKKGVQRVFEPACGTGRLLFRLGRAGYEVSGLDLNPRAVEFCNQRLERYELPPTVFVGDMADFKLKKQVDAGFNMINSFRHLLSQKQAVAHLQCMAGAIRKGGIYILGLHLTPTRGEPMTEESWSARRGNLVINTHLQTFETDLKARTERCRMEMQVYTPTEQRTIVDELVFRTYTKDQFFKLLDEAGGFEIEEVFDFQYDLDAPVEIAADTQDVVLILRRK